MGFRCFPAVVLVVLVLVPPMSPANSADWIADRDIGSYCQQYLTRPNSPSGAVCLSYIQGFLDGLRTTEVPAFPLPDHQDAGMTEEEAAAISTERRNALVDEYGPPARAGICLPENLARDEVVRVIARALRYGQSSGRSALDDYAQAALQERYPCDTSDPMEFRDAEQKNHDENDAEGDVQ